MIRITIFLFFFTLSTMAQITITGKVTDKEGNPLANITVKTDVITYTNEGYYVTNYVTTDANGMYKIQAKQWDTILDRNIELVELAGAKIIEGLLDEYEPLLEMDENDFTFLRLSELS